MEKKMETIKGLEFRVFVLGGCVASNLLGT